MIQVKAPARRGRPNSAPSHTRATTARREKMLARLQDIPLFKALSPAQLEKLAGAGRHRAVRAREVLYQQDEPASSCFVVLGGAMRFSVALGIRQATSALAFTNDLFGLESLQARATRRETAVAGGPVDLLEFEAGFLRGFLVENPCFQLRLLNYLVARYQEALSRLVRSGHYDAEQRLAAYLIDHCAGLPRRECRQNAVMSQAELADYLALSPETLCRKVSKFRKLGWVGGRGNEYIVRQPAALQHLLDR